MVYLIGAGPGDAGLMTCKGLEILKKADVVIYDDLGTPELMEFIPDSCMKIYVGKRTGKHSMPQDRINEIIIDSAKKYKTVVRLKGGDPFVFGRGGEEAEALGLAEIAYKIIPGVSSAIAVPEQCGIPVTHRGVARSFHVITGHTKDKDGYAKKEVRDYALSGGTGVFLMGIHNIKNIVNDLLECGMDENTPVAVISKGGCPGEMKITGRLSNICNIAEKSEIKTPAIIVVGETAAYDFVSRTGFPLASLHIGITGTKTIRNKLKNAFEELGARTYSLADMKVVKGPDADRFYDVINEIDKYDWIAFTSQNAIDIFFDTMKRNCIDIRRLANVKFAVVGNGTRDALMRNGIVADIMPEKYTTFELAKTLIAHMSPGEKLLLPRALQGSSDMTGELNRAGIHYDDLHIYDVRAEHTEAIRYLPDLDVITFVSSSGVKGFFDENEEYISIIKENNIKIAALGEITCNALKSYGLEADILPEKCDVEGLVSAVTVYNEKKV